MNLPAGFSLVEEESNMYTLSQFLSHSVTHAPRGPLTADVSTFSEEYLPGGSDDGLQISFHSRDGFHLHAEALIIIEIPKVEAICRGAWTAGEE